MIKPCLHCGEDTKKITEDFCCSGCDAAYRIINKLGFENYYKLRQIDPKERKMKPEEDEKINIDEFVLNQKEGSYSISLMVQGLHCAACVWLIESILKKQKNVIKARINLSKKSLFLHWVGEKEDGNKLVSIISDIGYKLLPFDEEVVKAEEKKYDDKILKALAVAGFGMGNVMLFSIVLWVTGPENLGVNTRSLLHFFSALLALPVIIYSSRPFFASALRSIKAGYPNMDLPISMAIFLACVVSLLESFRGQNYVYFDSVVMLIFFLLIGRYLDMKARKKAFSIVSEFALLSASFGRVESLDGKTKILPIKEIQQDMILIVAAGEKIAADGIVIEGKSEVDASLINGETLPKMVEVGAQVFSGMINLEAPLRVQVTKVAQDSLLAQIVHLSEDVESKKNHYVRIADRLSKIYTPGIHILAFLTFCLWYFYFGGNWEDALMKATAVLIVTCPCALALAVPIVQTIAISNFIKKGILVKSGEALERLREVDVIIFDKTGSLTVGKPRLVDVKILKQVQDDGIGLQHDGIEIQDDGIGLQDEGIEIRDDGIEIKSESVRRLELVSGSLTELQKNHYLKLAASLAAKSKHPISAAISKSYLGELESLSVQENRGFGLESIYQNQVIKLGRKDFCEIRSVVLNDSESENFITSFMKIGEEEIMFLLSDEIKEDAPTVIEQLKKLNKRIILLSGDGEKIVRDVAFKTEIFEFYFEQTPLSKAEFLQKLKAQNHKVLMIGDGLNDAPSLAAADVSISFSDGSDISQNIADIVIQGQKLEPIIAVINSSKKAMSLMKENLIIALIYNLIAVPFAVAGFIKPLIAAFAMSSSSLMVLLNSLRMNKKG